MGCQNCRLTTGEVSSSSEISPRSEVSPLHELPDLSPGYSRENHEPLRLPELLDGLKPIPGRQQMLPRRTEGSWPRESKHLAYTSTLLWTCLLSLWTLPPESPHKIRELYLSVLLGLSG